MRDFSGVMKSPGGDEWFSSGAKLAPISSGSQIGPAFSEPSSSSGLLLGPMELEFPPAPIISGVGEKRAHDDETDTSTEDQQPSKQRILSKEEVRDVCATSAKTLPAGMFSKVATAPAPPPSPRPARPQAVHLMCRLSRPHFPSAHRSAAPEFYTALVAVSCLVTNRASLRCLLLEQNCNF